MKGDRINGGIKVTLVMSLLLLIDDRKELNVIHVICAVSLALLFLSSSSCNQLCKLYMIALFS